MRIVIRHLCRFSAVCRRLLHDLDERLCYRLSRCDPVTQLIEVDIHIIASIAVLWHVFYRIRLAVIKLVAVFISIACKIYLIACSAFDEFFEL